MAQKNRKDTIPGRRKASVGRASKLWSRNIKKRRRAPRRRRK